jgi:signal transduction histidine kinase
MSMRILKMAVSSEVDVVGARQRAREIAVLCGFHQQDQARIATSVSELARNTFSYAGGGHVTFSVEQEEAGQVLQVRIDDRGPGIANLDEILAGRYTSRTGMGLGLIGARRLMDRCDIATSPYGTQIVLGKRFAPDAPALSPAMIGKIGARLAALAPDAMLAEVQQQNKELLGTLAELKVRQEELLQMTRALEETNRGVRALYDELDEKARHLHHANQMKSRFLSNMSHEFRTPLSSIRNLAKLLLSRADGELTPEQEKQVQFILHGTVALSEMVDDLLDLAKIEAGKIDVRPESFTVAELFADLRGVLRPLATSPQVTLLFDDPPVPARLFTDQAKLAQILRNFVSNALKYTERGMVSVRAALLDDSAIRFDVSDTGIGIAREHLDLIFEEFIQIENHLQAATKGTGLGLPLCRKLAGLLGGAVAGASTPGAGSVFSVTLPLVFEASRCVADGAAKQGLA